MNERPPPRSRRLALPSATLLLLAACADHGALPGGGGPSADGQLAALVCEVRVAAGTLQCADASGTTSGGRGDARRQGAYVRLAGTNGARNGTDLSVDVTVQNVANLALATANGSAPHPWGVRVLIATPPAATEGTGAVAVADPDGRDLTAGDRPYIQYGGRIGRDVLPELGADGVLASREVSAARPWRFTVAPGVERFAFVVQVRAKTGPGTLATVAPQVTATSAATLLPGRMVTLTGLNFNPAAAGNTVRIGGVQAAVTGGGATSLDVVVPCIPSGPAAVEVEHGGLAGVPVLRALQVARRALAPGQSAVLSRSGQADCNELAPAGGDARYLLAVYNASNDPWSAAGFQLSAGGASPPAAPAAAPPAFSAQPRGAADDPHLRIMEMNRREHARLRARFAGDARTGARRSTAADAGEPPLTRTIRVVDVYAGTCDQFYTVSATRVYYDGRIAIYEDDATPAWARAAANPRMAGYYKAIGDDYNGSMHPIIRQTFGDPLLRDAQMDGNGILVALFTPLLNTAFGGVPAFVVSCDFWPNGEGNAASNFGEFLYAFQPTVNASGYSGLTPENWYWNLRSGIAHEVKHIASLTARSATDALLDEAWLEEGTARHAEELWARNAVYGVAWKGNTGYGSEADPGSIYCDFKRTSPACLAAENGRPSLTMFRHFQGLGTYMRNPSRLSPFGTTPAGGATYYETAWSLVRYAIDRYGASDAAFLGALTSSSATGTENLAARAGVPLEELLGGWALSLYADDYPGLASPHPDLQMPTWNFRDIYAGLHAEFRNAFPTPYPLAPRALAFGAFAPVDVPAVAGGGVAYFELSGPQAQAQLLSLRGPGGGALPPTVRMAIARLQ